ncbi:HAMP domain-containing protein [Acidovorax sp. HDW3]|uniref:methyl-accepting chemotaxis protein n=1 Tax=Acidovorax sp. HDW3 TaxID=2714923 RepID=UPI00140AE2CC|nr:methyl-accepting chemotaxis protein [Acidovorax sp. HDW3]QIL44409.1 HAMP domain-containing protein [Acidovorax sp. HDW3]
MPQLRMAHKLWVAVIAIVIALVAVVGFSGYRTAKSQAHAEASARAMNAKIEAALRWVGLTETNAARTLSLVVSSEAQLAVQFKEAIPATSAQISEIQKNIEAMQPSEADKAQLDKIAAARKAMLELRTEATRLKDAGQATEAGALVRQSYQPAVAAYVQTLRDFVDLQKKQADERAQEIAANRLLTVKIAAAVVGLLILLIVGGAFFLIGSIERPLAQAQALAERIAGGDLSEQQNVMRGDEFGALLRALYTMSASLARMVGQVRQSTDSIATASAEIATGNHDLSARTEHTSSNLQETAAAMEQFSSTLQHSASSARQASSLAASASDVARRGGEVVGQVVTTMQDIHHSSQKIADIIGVIDGIAFQTNILALNAAVEAARAGEQGRGFAVVAGEVRSLAGRSAEAAKEIKQLISASVERVDSGSRLVESAGSTMQEVVQAVQRVTDMIGEITAASTEQSTGVAQVNQAVGQLDQMTQQNAALVEQSAAAAQSLREQAEQLAQAVAVFKVAAGAQMAFAAPRAAAVPRPAPMARPTAARPAVASSAPKKSKNPSLAATPSTAPSAAPLAAPKIAAKATDDGDWESF